MERDRCGRLISASYYPRDLPLAPAAQPCPAHHGRHDSLPGQFVSIYQMCDTPLPVNWTIETLNTTVDKELAALPVDMRARFVRICELIEDGRAGPRWCAVYQAFDRSAVGNANEGQGRDIASAVCRRSG